MTHFFPPKALQLQKRHLYQGMFKPHTLKIRKLICHMNKMVEYLEYLLYFWQYQAFI